MVDVNTQNKTISVNVSSSGVSSNVNASGDTTLYYSNKAREWAISNRIVDGVDYSSKYYAGRANQSALNAQSFAQSAQDSYNNFQDSVDGALSNIDSSVQTAITTIDTKSGEAVETINNSVDGVIEDIEAEANEQIANIERTGFYMRDDKLYFINSEGEEQEFKSGGGGLEIGDIGPAPLGIDETKGLRRYLNGQVIIQDQYLQFTNKVKSAQALYPNLFVTEEQWQATVTMSAFGACYKFVVDDGAGTIRLPKITGFIQGLTDLSSLGDLVEAGLPNITGGFDTGDRRTHTNGTGAFYSTTISNSYYASQQTSSQTNEGFGFDASRSSSVYKDDVTTVQPESGRYPYFIQVATGAETEDNIINEIELNNPYSFGDSKYSQIILNNLSWLRSAGQYNPKATYPSYYDWLLTEYNNPTSTISENINIVGTLTNNNGVFSGFTADNYLTTPQQFTNTSQSWELILPVKMNSLAQANQFVLGAIEYSVSFCINSDGTIAFYASSNGTSWNLASAVRSTLTIEANVQYYIKTAWTGSAYVVSVSTDKETYTPYITVSSTASVPATTFKIGTSKGGGSPAVGAEINILEATLTSNGNSFWRGGASKVKLSTEAYTDYDWVVNTADETFRLPLLDGSEDLPSDGYIEIDFPASSAKITAPKNGFYMFLKQPTSAGQYLHVENVTNGVVYEVRAGSNGGSVGASIFAKRGDIIDVYYSLAGTLEEARFSQAQGNGSLYFYVGETVQNAHLINAGRIEEKLADCITRSDCKAYIVETFVSGTNGYNVYSNGYCEEWGNLVIGTYNYTFLKTFKSAPNLQITRYSNVNTGASVYDVVGSTAVPSTTGFRLSGANFTSNFFTGGSWKACGYIA